MPWIEKVANEVERSSFAENWDISMVKKLMKNKELPGQETLGVTTYTIRRYLEDSGLGYVQTQERIY